MQLVRMFVYIHITFTEFKRKQHSNMSGYYTVYIARDFVLEPNETLLIGIGDKRLENNWYF